MNYYIICWIHPSFDGASLLMTAQQTLCISATTVPPEEASALQYPAPTYVTILALS